MTITETALVRAVWSKPTRRPDTMRYTIGLAATSGSHRGGPPYWSVATIDPWQASLCERAEKTGRAVRVSSRPSQYFEDDLIDIEIAEGDAHADVSQ
jgi:hypothetical protein